jgi:uncharacterized phage-associated protein
MAETTANAVADFFLSFCQEHGDCLTNLRLQKLVYYAQAWHLALYNAPLFDEKFQAWVHGPVVPSLYQRFKRYGWQPITAAVSEPNISGHVREHLEEVFNVYGRYSAWDLERMTHSEEPWTAAREGLDLDENCEREISDDLMLEYYRRLAERG